jgi:hypothetical protein
MATANQITAWLAEADAAIRAQPEATWTIARMRLAYPNPTARSLVQLDTVVAAGSCKATATVSSFNNSLQRTEIQAVFSNFELRGRSSIVGPFTILLQAGRQAQGRFRQQFADSLWPIHGAWTVPFVIETSLGSLIPRPTDEEVILKSASPGEFSIPPIGVWFEKWDPIDLVLETNPDGPTLAICEQAMHCMVNVGANPAMPDFYVR